MREKQGSTYTPFVVVKSVKGFGYMFAGVEPKPDEADRFETLAEITKELRDGSRRPTCSSGHASRCCISI